MIQDAVDLLKEFARPSSVTFTIAVLAAGVALVFARRTARAARWYFAGTVALYWIIASPAVAERLVLWRGAPYRPIATAADARGAGIIVVLGAGNVTVQAAGMSLNQVSWLAALRLLEAARVYRLLDRPMVIVSGGVTRREQGARSEGEAMRTAMIELGVPADHIVIEAESKTTREEALVIARLLSNRARQPILLVTSPTHMSRALGVFRRAGLDPVPAVAPHKSEHSLERLRWVPHDDGLWLFDIFVYDTAATWYYRLRGWTD